VSSRNSFRETLYPPVFLCARVFAHDDRPWWELVFEGMATTPPLIARHIPAPGAQKLEVIFGQACEALRWRVAIKAVKSFARFGLPPESLRDLSGIQVLLEVDKDVPYLRDATQFRDSVGRSVVFELQQVRQFVLFKFAHAFADVLLEHEV
jgi:hypothetical protein